MIRFDEEIKLTPSVFLVGALIGVISLVMVLRKIGKSEHEGRRHDQEEIEKFQIYMS